MVDVGVATHEAQIGDLAAVASGAIRVRKADNCALTDYEALCKNATFGPAQHPLWVRAWVEATGADAIVVTVHREGRPVQALALEVVRQGPFRVARFVGESHANGNFVPTLRDLGDRPSAPDSSELARAIRASRPDIDLVALERQNPDQDGRLNPMTALASMRSPNVSLAIDLAGGFDATLDRSNGKRKRKKFRYQQRRFEDAGGFRFIDPKTPDEVDRLIDGFFVMKAARFEKKGISNVFGCGKVQAFFRRLFRDALELANPPFILRGLEVGGALRAVNGISVTRDSFVCDFGGILDDDSNTSPGYFLDYDGIRVALERGLTRYDLSVGDEAYKRSWCDIETWQFDCLVPVTSKGHLLFALKHARAGAIRAIKSNATLWTFAKTMRKKALNLKTGAEG